MCFHGMEIEPTMVLEALTGTFDGNVLLVDRPLKLQPNTRVIIRLETLEKTSKRTHSFLQTARSLNLDGPSDWSDRLDEYLYHRQVESNE